LLLAVVESHLNDVLLKFKCRSHVFLKPGAFVESLDSLFAERAVKAVEVNALTVRLDFYVLADAFEVEDVLAGQTHAGHFA